MINFYITKNKEVKEVKKLEKECWIDITNPSIDELKEISKLTNTDYDIYMHAKRIIYSLPNYEESFKDELKLHNIMLEFSLTRLKESNIVDIKDFFIYDFLKENISLTITSCDMTTLNTDILNEWCLMFNNYPLVLLDMVKLISNNLSKACISSEEKDRLINEIREKS